MTRERDGYRDYDVDPVVLAQARQLGLIGNVEKRVKRMARHSAPITHKEGNRRYESFILRIDKGVVRSICKFDPSTGEVTRDVLGQIEERHRMLRAIEKHLEPPSPPASSPSTPSKSSDKQRRGKRRSTK
jgi:hypothetical protein